MEFIVVLIQIGVPLSLLILGYTIGRQREKKHLQELELKEKRFSHIMVSDIKRIPTNWKVYEATLVTGSVVIATDYFKVFAGQLRNLFGGNVRSYETLLERGRREAIIRMLEEAQKKSANAVWNVRIETMTTQGKTQAGGIELLAYGTAMRIS